MIENKCECPICYDSVSEIIKEKKGKIEILACCSAGEEIHFVCSGDCKGNQTKCPLCRSEFWQIPTLADVELNTRYLAESLPQRVSNLFTVDKKTKAPTPINGVEFYLKILNHFHSNGSIDLTKSDRHGKTYRDYFLLSIQPTSEFYAPIEEFLVKIGAGFAPDTLTNDQYSHKQKSLYSIHLLKKIIGSSQLSHSGSSRHELWQARNFLSHIYNTKIAQAIHSATAHDASNQHLICAYDVFKTMDSNKSVLGLYFMALIQIKLKCDDKAVTLCKMILENHTNLSHLNPISDINDNCFKFAARFLTERNELNNGALILYNAKKPGKEAGATMMTIQAISANDYPMVKQGLQYLLKIIGNEADNLEMPIIKMAIDLLKKQQYCNELRTLLDKYRLTPLFQKPNDDYSNSRFLKSYFIHTRHDLTYEFAEAITNGTQLFLFQTTRVQRFFANFPFDKSNSAVKSSYDNTQKTLDDKQAWIEKTY